MVGHTPRNVTHPETKIQLYSFGVYTMKNIKTNSPISVKKSFDVSSDVLWKLISAPAISMIVIRFVSQMKPFSGMKMVTSIGLSISMGEPTFVSS